MLPPAPRASRRSTLPVCSLRLQLTRAPPHSGVLVGVALDRAGYVDQALSAVKDAVPAGSAQDFLASLQRDAVPLIAAQTATAVTAAAVRTSNTQAAETRAGDKSGSGVLAALAAVALGALAYRHRAALRTALAEVCLPPCPTA